VSVVLLPLLLGACAGLPAPGPVLPPASVPTGGGATPAPAPAPVTIPVARRASEAFLTEGEARAARNRYLGDPAAQAFGRALIARADALASAPLDIPRAGGQWTHWYVCPVDGGKLEAQSPTAHRCARCGAIQSGWPYDDVYISHRHMHWIQGVETLAWAHVLDPKPAYVQRAREILLTYAGFYRDLPLRDKDRGESRSAARLHAQTLDEAVALCRVSVGLGLLREAPGIASGDVEAIAEGLIRPMAATVSRNSMGISNWQSWHNAALACAGFLLGDRGLTERALRGVNGFRFQLEQAVFPSGLWHEEAPMYHWYALHAHLYLLEAAARGGENLYGDPRVRGLFDAPLRQLYPDYSFPALHNSDRASIRDMGQYYAVAWRRYGDLRYAALATKYDHPWVLFWGAPVPSGTPDPPLRTSNDASEGLAILRDAENRIAAFLDYGPGKSGHVHPAKLNLLLFAGGNERLVDPGRLPYGSALQRDWYTQTLAHNTVVVDGRSQARSAGRLVRFEAHASLYQLRQEIARLARDPALEAVLMSALDPAAPLSLVVAGADAAYPGVRLERLVALQGSTLVDLFEAHSESPAVFDLPLHWRATLRGLEGATPAAPLGEANGYPLLRDLRQAPPGTRGFVADLGARGSIAVRLLDGLPVYVAEGHGRPPDERNPVVIRRAAGTRAVFAAVYTVAQPGAR
jgi:hypothetical protein